MPATADEIDIDAELDRCCRSPVYFVWNYCRIKDRKSKGFIPFRMWPDQVGVLRLLFACSFAILLKARQIGMTTLVVCYAVWLAIFRPGSLILIFSKTQNEAKDVLRRIKATVASLPSWQQPSEILVDATQQWEWSNGSRFITFASRGPGGDSYTADLVIIDEADLIPELNQLLEGAEPTVAGGGQLVLLSRVDKGKPNSPFKEIWRGAVKGENEYKPKFIPWFSRPDRSPQWYETQKRNIESRTGALDDLYAQYPATPEEALAPRQLDKRFPIKWLQDCFEDKTPLPLTVTPLAGVAGFRCYELPKVGCDYIIGMDVAEGNPNSDDSVCCVLNRTSLRQVAVLSGKYEPAALAQIGKQIADWYRNAWIQVERNNHGFSCIDELRKLRARILAGPDNKLGWWTHLRGKVGMYNSVAEALRCRSCTITDKQTLDQLAELDAVTLAAPESGGRDRGREDTDGAVRHDDCAVAFALALVGAATPVRKGDLHVQTFNRTPDAVDEERIRELKTLGTGVKYFPSLGEYWVQRERDGQRHDIFGTTDEAAAQLASATVDALLAGQPIGDSAVELEVSMWVKARGWV